MISSMFSEIQLSKWEKTLLSSALIAGYSLTELAVTDRTKEKLNIIAERILEIPDAWRQVYGKQIKEEMKKDELSKRL